MHFFLTCISFRIEEKSTKMYLFYKNFARMKNEKFKGLTNFDICKTLIEKGKKF